MQDLVRCYLAATVRTYFHISRGKTSESFVDLQLRTIVSRMHAVSEAEQGGYFSPPKLRARKACDSYGSFGESV